MVPFRRVSGERERERERERLINRTIITGVINFDERVIRAGQEVKGGSNVSLPLSPGSQHQGEGEDEEVAVSRESIDRNPRKIIDENAMREKKQHFSRDPMEKPRMDSID